MAQPPLSLLSALSASFHPHFPHIRLWSLSLRTREILSLPQNHQPSTTSKVDSNAIFL
jgi:hypothetical protein